MNTSKNWKIEENKTQINYIRLNGWGLVTIFKVPEVDVLTCKVTGYTYSVKSTKKGTQYQRFSNIEAAKQAATKRMEQFN